MVGAFHWMRVYFVSQGLKLVGGWIQNDLIIFLWPKTWGLKMSSIKDESKWEHGILRKNTSEAQIIQQRKIVRRLRCFGRTCSFKLHIIASSAQSEEQMPIVSLQVRSGFSSPCCCFLFFHCLSILPRRGSRDFQRLP